MSNEVVEISTENGLVAVNVSDIPDIITSSIDSISNLEEQVRNADQSASKAMDYVNNQMSRYKEKGVWIFKHRSGNTKDIIEDTQKAVEELAKVQQFSVEAIKKSFEFQKKLAQTSKFLFDLGCANITVNRIAVRAIKLKIEGASKETLSDLAKQEMLAVVEQLKKQEDILIKQEFLNAKVKEHALRLDNNESLAKEQSEKIKELSLATEGIYSAMKEKDIIDLQQNKRLNELEATLAIKENVDKTHEEAIRKNEQAIQMLFDYTKQKDEVDNRQQEEINMLKNIKGIKPLLILSLIIGIISLSISILSLIR